ncbi:hypothetical protein [Primorskyibacter sp. S187A]|uniref:hypothetical protein n=1 Tax=Primorskyibacter sp. S187A TaxID=3415130 RepID=UPI003C7B2F2D
MSTTTHTGMIINLGLPKSGTTTLARALRRAGLHTADHRIKPAQSQNTALHGAFVGDVMYRGFFRHGDPLEGLEEFRALTEISALKGEKSLWPQTDWALLDAIQAKHPDARFVASRRDAVLMSDSMQRWSNLGRERLPGATVPGLPFGYGARSSERVRWINGHYAALERYFAGATHFLSYDTAALDAPDLLSRFLDLDLPWWGRANSNPVRRVA